MLRWSSINLPMRIFAFVCFQAVLLGVLAELTVRAGESDGHTDALKGLLKENQFIEWAQVGLVAATMCLGWGVYRVGTPVLHRVLIILAGVPLFRELDRLIESIFWEDFHHILMGAVFASTALLVGTHWKEFLSCLPEFARRPGFYFMLFGALLSVIYAQILGQRTVWKVLAPEETSFAKRFIEEGLEMMGYFCVLFGVLEELYFSGRAEPGASRGEVSR